MMLFVYPEFLLDEFQGIHSLAVCCQNTRVIRWGIELNSQGSVGPLTPAQGSVQAGFVACPRTPRNLNLYPTPFFAPNPLFLPIIRRHFR